MLDWTRGGQTTASQIILCGPSTLVETSINLIHYDRGSHTCRAKEPMTLESRYVILSLK